MKLNLVEDWRQGHRWFSVRFLGLSIALQGAYAALPDRIHDDLPTWVTKNFASAIFAVTVLAVIARFIRQDGKDDDAKPQGDPGNACKTHGEP